MRYKNVIFLKLIRKKRQKNLIMAFGTFFFEVPYNSRLYQIIQIDVTNKFNILLKLWDLKMEE